MNRRLRHREPVLIYGAGQGGVRLAASLSDSPKFFPVAFIDDNLSLSKTRIDGLPVHSPDVLQAVMDETRAKRILLAIPSAPRQLRRDIVNKLEPLAIRVQTIPDVGDLISGVARVDDIRDVPVEDLLGREPVPPRADLLSQENSDRIVLITGAGGSIGSELCRKIYTLRPRKLLLLERSEIALYSVQNSLKSIENESLDGTEVIGLLGCVTDQVRMEEVMSAYSVNTVYHAAAYKHVPIVEQNIFQGIENNVFGTLSTAKAAINTGVSTFVLISTDKAVSPTNVMGASKRLAELILQSFSHSQSGTRFCMVRFGNVLASSGSVIPLFREQIRSGGPVTVTHPEITRYFMTIPEAAELVIQAGALAKGGDVFVLDMGEPVKIVDLAHKLIHLMGHEVRSDTRPNGDIQIVFSGLRPAEKLYEELLIGSNVTGTRHKRIMRATEQYLQEHELVAVLGNLRACAERRDWRGLINALSEVVEGYTPTMDVQDHLFKETDVGHESRVAEIDLYRNR